jgi:4'-phosphopantetheinyl transferase
VHLWWAHLSQPFHIHRLWTYLTADEHQRALRFRQQQSRDRFIVARGILRLLLSQYLDCSPQSLELIYGVHGKPALGSPPFPLEFNLTHSEEIALYAFALQQSLGIDLERVRSGVDYAAIARRFFAPCEQHYLQSLPTTEQAQGFFQLWTYKEAWLKARGGSVFSGLQQLEISQAHDSLTQERQGIFALDAPAGYVAALAILPSPETGTFPPMEIKGWEWGEV